MLAPWKTSYDQPRQHFEKQKHCFANKGPSSQSHGFSSSHVWMWELGDKESWAPKNKCFWIVVLEKTLESPWNCKDIKFISPKGNQAWIFIGRTDAEAEATILWPPDVKNWHAGKDPDVRKDWRQNRMREGEMVGWHHWLVGHEFEQSLWVGDGQRSLGTTTHGLQRVRHNWVTELNWIELMKRTYNMKWLVSLYDWCVGALVSARMYVL